MNQQTCIMTIVLSVLCTLGCTPYVQAGGQEYSELRMSRQMPLHGIYDPSLEYAKDAGWMTYSLIEMPNISTCLAKSTDSGRSWAYVNTINAAAPDSITTAKGKISGVWRNEVSSLVHDPDDPGREWKLFWHKYFAREPYADEDRLFDRGWIAYRTAPRPEGPWSEEIRLLASRQFLSPEYEVENDLNSLHPDLAGYRFFSEPAALYLDGILYLCLEGSRRPEGLGDWEDRKIFLLASKDHGRSWRYVNKLIGYADAENLGYVVLMAASMFENGGKVFLMVTPAGSIRKEHKDADGMYVFTFKDIRTGELDRDGQKKLAVYDYIQPDKNVSDSGGHGDYDKGNIAGGIIIGQVKKPNILNLIFKKEGDTFFKIMNTNRGISSNAPAK